MGLSLIGGCLFTLLGDKQTVIQKLNTVGSHLADALGIDQAAIAILTPNVPIYLSRLKSTRDVYLRSLPETVTVGTESVTSQVSSFEINIFR